MQRVFDFDQWELAKIWCCTIIITISYPFLSIAFSQPFFPLQCFEFTNLLISWGRIHKGPFTQAISVAQLNTVFVAPKLQLQYRACKPAAISARFYRRDIAGVSNLFET